jgi:hypothetical protein
MENYDITGDKSSNKPEKGPFEDRFYNCLHDQRDKFNAKAQRQEMDGEFINRAKGWERSASSDELLHKAIKQREFGS